MGSCIQTIYSWVQDFGHGLLGWGFIYSPGFFCSPGKRQECRQAVWFEEEGISQTIQEEAEKRDPFLGSVKGGRQHQNRECIEDVLASHISGRQG